MILSHHHGTFSSGGCACSSSYRPRAILLWPTGRGSVLNGTIDDSYNGLPGWFWAVCSVTSIALVALTRSVLRERRYSAVMAATGLLYLVILTAFGMGLAAQATLA